MSNLQVKNLPEELHEAHRERTHTEHTTVSDLVTQMLYRELSRPSMAEWLAEVRKLPRHDDLDFVEVLDDVKDEIEGR